MTEAARRLEPLLLADAGRTQARARALVGASAVALDHGDFAAGRQRAEEALTLNRELGDRWDTAFSIHLLAYTAMSLGDWKTARERFDESLRAFRALGDEHMVGIATDLLGLAVFQLGDRDKAIALEEENLRRARAAGDVRVEAKALGAIGMYKVDGGRIDDAIPLLVESTRIFRELGTDVPETAQNLESLARAVAVAGEADAAARILSAAGALLDEIGVPPGAYEVDLNEETLAIIRRTLDEAAFVAAWEEGRKLTVDDAVALAIDSFSRR
jgi:tetratricopeptide (TPR) repeat protein